MQKTRFRVVIPAKNKGRFSDTSPPPSGGIEYRLPEARPISLEMVAEIDDQPDPDHQPGLWLTSLPSG